MWTGMEYYLMLNYVGYKPARFGGLLLLLPLRKVIGLNSDPEIWLSEV